MDKKKDGLIELQDKNDKKTLRMTSEENRMRLSKEFKNLQNVLNNFSSVNKYSWSVDGEKVKINILMINIF
jgi:hypothetical protein